MLVVQLYLNKLKRIKKNKVVKRIIRVLMTGSCFDSSREGGGLSLRKWYVNGKV
jgi:hypothetical protein